MVYLIRELEAGYGYTLSHNPDGQIIGKKWNSKSDLVETVKDRVVGKFRAFSSSRGQDNISRFTGVSAWEVGIPAFSERTLSDMFIER